MPNWMEVMQNPKSFALRKMMYEFLKEKYVKNEDVLDRIAAHLVTEKDMQQFTQLVTDIYETGFTHAVNQHKVQLEKLGLQVKLVQPKDGQ